MNSRALCGGSLGLAARPARFHCQHQMMRRSLCSSRLRLAMPAAISTAVSTATSTAPRLRMSIIPGTPLQRIQKGPFPSLRDSPEPALLFRRPLFYTVRNRQGKGEDLGKPPTAPGSKPPSSPSPPPPRGIRKVLPISIPSLTPHENIYTVPNLLTFSRLFIAPFIGYAIVQDAHAWALGLFVYAGVSDLLDGWIARHWKLQTVVGSVVDPMADKALMTILTVSLAAQGSLPVWLAVIILGRDVGLAISAIYYRYISLPPPKTFMRYWDFSLPSAEVRPTTISKYNTFLQLGLMGATMVNPLVPVDASTALAVLQYTVAVTTIWSGLSYIFSKDAVKILSENKKK